MSDFPFHSITLDQMDRISPNFVHAFLLTRSRLRFVSLSLELGLYSMIVLGILCAQLLPQFYVGCFETLQMFRSWSEDVHMFGYNPQII